MHQDKPIILNGASWIEPQGAVTLFDDFLVDVLADDPYFVDSPGASQAAASAISATAGAPGSTALGGWVAGSTQAIDAIQDQGSWGGLGTGAGTPWMRPDRAGNGVLVAEFGMVMPVALTARQYFFGLTDDPVETTTLNPSINITTAYTVVLVADDAAGFIYSSLGTLPTVWKYGSALATVASAVSAATVGVTAVVDCYTVMRVEIDSAGNAYYYQTISASSAFGRVQPTSMIGANALAVTPTIALVPYFAAAGTTTTTVEWEIDYCFASQAR
jgi:hypothetical protein